MVWIPQPGPEHTRILGQLITAYEVSGNLIPDAQLAALEIEHGIPIGSTDTDFARFRELRWIDPLGMRTASRHAAAKRPSGTAVAFHKDSARSPSARYPRSTWPAFRPIRLRLSISSC